MIKIVITVLAITCSMLSLQAQNIVTPGDVKTKPLVSINPEEDAVINAFVSLGYYRWMMISESDYMGLFTGKAAGAGFSHDAEPIVLKRYGVKTNVLFMKFGMDYFSDKLSLPQAKTGSEDVDASRDEKARQLKLLGGVKLGPFVIETNVIFREFNSTITSKGYRDYNGTVTPLIYYPKDGNPVSLAPGDKASWYTKYREYDIRLVMPSRYFSAYAGVKYMVFDAPSSMSINYDSWTPPYTFVYGSGDVLAFTRNRIANAFIGFDSDIPVGPNLFWHMGFPISFALPGGYSVKSGLFKSQKPPLLDYSSISVSSLGDLSLQFRTAFFSMKAGAEYGFYYSHVTPRNPILKQNVSFYDTLTHTTMNVPAGEKVDITISRIELFWGLYFSASLYF